MSLEYRFFLVNTNIEIADNLIERYEDWEDTTDEMNKENEMWEKIDNVKFSSDMVEQLWEIEPVRDEEDGSFLRMQFLPFGDWTAVWGVNWFTPFHSKPFNQLEFLYIYHLLTSMEEGSEVYSMNYHGGSGGGSLVRYQYDEEADHWDMHEFDTSINEHTWMERLSELDDDIFAEFHQYIENEYSSKTDFKRELTKRKFGK